MNRITSLLICILLSISALSQYNEIDSLHRLLEIEKNDSNRVRLLLDAANEYASVKPDSSLWYYSQALELSKAINYKQAEINANLRMTELFARAGNFPEALRVSLQNSKIYEDSHDLRNIFFAKRNLLWIYSNIGDSLRVRQTEKELDSLADLELLKDEKTGRLFKQVFHHNLAIRYDSEGEYDSAFKYERFVYNQALQNDDAEWLALSTSTLADFYAKADKVDSEFYYYKGALIYAEKAGRSDIVREVKGALASSFEKRGQNDSAVFYAYQYYNESRAVPDTTSMTDAALLLSKFYNKRQQFDSAYKYLSEFTSLKEKSLNQERIEKAQSINFNESLHQQQLAAERNQTQREYRSKMRIYGLIGGLTIMLVLAIILYQNNRQKQKTNILLQAQKEEIQDTLRELKSTQSQLIQSEKMASLGELTAGIAHEIQNPLNFVNNFSEVNTELVDELKSELTTGNLQLANEIADDIKHNEQKINYHGKRADAIVKGMLQHSRISSGVKEATDINALCDEYLRLAYHGLRARDKSFNAKFEADFDPSIGKINVVPQDIGRVLLNFINNAFYATNEKKKSLHPLKMGEEYEPEVTVSTKRPGSPSGDGGKIEIKVKDNGNGIPQNIIDKIFQPFFTTKPTGEGTGLGLSLSYDIIKAHGGEIKVETNEGEGTTFIIQLPLA